MKRSLKVVFLSGVLMLPTAGMAADLLINTFLQSRPFKGVEMELNGKLVGETGAMGDAKASVDAGRHELRLLKNGIPLGDYNFELPEGRNAELSITFTSFDTPPEFALSTYAEGEQALASEATGTIGGEVLNVEGLPVQGAQVSVLESDALVTTNDLGAFELALPRGSYTLAVSHPDYQPIQKDGFRVVANVGLATSIKLMPIAGSGVQALSATADEEIVVMGTYKPTENTVDLERFSVAITDAISIDELLRFGDSDVAASLRRLVGVAVTGGRYAVVRGLDGRYIAATLNGNLMPSTDPYRRDVQLDLFPNDILEGIEIQKSFTADMPGDTTGGIIKIRTRGLPDEAQLKLSASIGATTGATGDDVLTYSGGGTDWLGVDDGKRELPGGLSSDFTVCQTASQPNCIPRADAAALASTLPNVYTPRTESASPNIGFGLSGGNVFEHAIGTAGFYGSVSYDQKATSRQDAFIDNASAQYTATYSRDKVETGLNGYFVAGVESDRWQFLSKTMLLRSTEDTVQVEEGINRSFDQSVREVLLEWLERQFLAQQFEGTVYLPRAHEANWRLGYSQTSREAPDRRSYSYVGNDQGDGTFSTPAAIIPTIERSYADLTEDSIDFGVDYKVPMQLSDAISTDVVVGVLWNQRDRDSDLARLGFSGGNGLDRTQPLEALLTAQNFENGVFTLRSTTSSTDAYKAKQDAAAVYVQSVTEIGQGYSVVAGLRKDDFSQEIRFPRGSATPVDLESNEILPSVGVTYRPNDRWQFRGGYSATVSRPNITENAPARFFDERGREYIGCTAAGAPACEASMIDNFDLRAEYYLDGGQDSISLAVFHKEIEDPMERAIADGSGSSLGALTFRNNESATVSGIEIDGNWTALNLEAHQIRVGGNVAFIESEIELGALGQQLEAKPNRELQGQSPFLANIQVGYDHFPTEQKLTLVINYFDDRIDSVARTPQTPIVEVGRATMNLNYEKGFSNRSKFTFRVKNLLDADIEYEQNNRVIEGYREGAELSMGYSYTF